MEGLYLYHNIGVENKITKHDESKTEEIAFRREFQFCSRAVLFIPSAMECRELRKKLDWLKYAGSDISVLYN